MLQAKRPRSSFEENVIGHKPRIPRRVILRFNRYSLLLREFEAHVLYEKRDDF